MNFSIIDQQRMFCLAHHILSEYKYELRLTILFHTIVFNPSGFNIIILASYPAFPNLR